MAVAQVSGVDARIQWWAWEFASECSARVAAVVLDYGLDINFTAAVNMTQDAECAQSSVGLLSIAAWALTN